MVQSTESVLHAHLGALRRRWLPGAIAVALVLAVGVPISMGLPNLYRSSATLIVDQVPDPLSQMSTQMLEVSGRLQTIRQEALSRQGVGEMAEELDLYPELRAAGSEDAVMAMMQRDVRVEPVSASRGDGRVTTVSFRVSYTGGDPVKVAAVANRLATYYVERSAAIRSRLASRTADALRAELDAMGRRLEAQNRLVTEFMTRNAGTLPAQITSITTKYGQIMTQVTSNSAEISRQIERRDSLQTQISTLMTPSAGADVTDPAVRLAQSRRDLENLLTRFEEAHYEVRSKRSEIANLERLVAQRGSSESPAAGSSQLETLRAQLADVNRRIESLRQANAGLQKDLTKYDAIIDAAPLKNAEFDRLTADQASTRTAYNNLSTRYQEALAGERAQAGTSGQDFQVLDPAVPAESPTAPDRRLLLGLSVVAALALGLGVALLTDRVDRSFRSVDELRAFTHVPVLATIPRIVSRKARTRQLIVGALAGAGACVALGFVSVGVFRMAQQAEALTRMLLR